MISQTWRHSFGLIGQLKSVVRRVGRDNFFRGVFQEVTSQNIRLNSISEVALWSCTRRSLLMVVNVFPPKDVPPTMHVHDAEKQYGKDCSAGVYSKGQYGEDYSAGLHSKGHACTSFFHQIPEVCKLKTMHGRGIAMLSSQPEVKRELLQGNDEGIMVVSLNRPDRKNAVGKAFLSQLQEAIEMAESDLSVRVIIIKSDVEGVFCAGADLKERRDQKEREVQQFVRSLRETFADLESLPCPTIAAVEGKALGGGCEFALACDLRVAGAKAAFALPETGLAIIPGAGATQRLPRVIGKPLAKELILTGAHISAEKAERIGLVNHCVPAGEAYKKALELARHILAKGPIAVRMAKAAIDRGFEVDLTSGLAIEEACYAMLLPTKDRLEALEAFKEKRTPDFKGE